ncbi:uncharacterized protein LOC144632255 isoform X2 [Oculina patagonica]
MMGSGTISKTSHPSRNQRNVGFVKKQKFCNVMFLCNEWKSSKGGLSTFNREFAVNLAKTSSNNSIKVHCYVSQSDELDREDARQHGVNLITAKSVPGSADQLDWLIIPPPELPHPDVVVGHGRKFGTPAFFIVRAAKCKWVHFVHVFCEDLGKYKLTESGVVDTIEENEKKHKSEIELCRAADAVVAVGSRLQHKYSRSLPGLEVEVITPGILEKFSSETTQQTTVAKKFNVFMFGRASFEDLTLKGYDVIANAIGSLGKKYELTFVGSPTGGHRKIEQWFLDNTCINRNQITIRSYCNEQDELKMMFQESDLVALPSRTEGFGLVALEAISAGVPVLVTDESGIAEALEKVEGGESVIVESEDAGEWAQRIQQLSNQSPEERENNAKLLRENYKRMYSWSKECGKFQRIIQNLVGQPPVTSNLNDSQTSSAVLVTRPGAPFADKMDKADKHESTTGRGLLQSNSPGSVVPTINQTTIDVNADKGETQSTENEDWKLLHSAVQGGNVAIIETVLSRGVDANSRDSYGNTPLMIAACFGKMEAVNYLLDKGADLSLTGQYGRNSLHSASEGGNVAIIETMLSSGLDINSKDSHGNTPIMIAALNGKMEAVNYLLDKGADPSLTGQYGRNILHNASGGVNVAIIKTMLSRGLDINSKDSNGDTPIMIAAREGKMESVNYLLDKGADLSLTGQYGRNSLHSASQGGNVAIIETMLSRGLDVNSKDSDGDTPIMIAAFCGKMEAVNYLLDKGADLSLTGRYGRNLLHSASYGGNVAIIETMLSRGLDVNSKDSDGDTPLMNAASCGKMEAVNYLLDKGVDLSLTGQYGRNLLHKASAGGNVAIIETMLSRGLNVNSKDSDGETPLTIAAANGHAEAVNYLLSRGAR